MCHEVFHDTRLVISFFVLVFIYTCIAMALAGRGILEYVYPWLSIFIFLSSSAENEEFSAVL